MSIVLLTGASGFLGRATLAPLAAAGFEVHAVARRPIVASAGVTCHAADLFDDRAVTAMIDRISPTHLLHFAWYAEPGKYWTSRYNLDWLAASTRLLAIFHARGGRRAVMAGTCAEYDWNHAICKEGMTPLAPATLYGTCKNAMQHVLAAYSRQHGLSSAWGRVFFPFGPHEQTVRLVPSVINAVLRGEPARCSSGEQVRDFIHVQDAADAFVALLCSDITGPVNIASGKAVAVKDVALTIGRMLGRPDLIALGALPSPKGEPPVLEADTGRLAGEVGWRPAMTLEQGLAATANWWRAAMTYERQA
jgi:nucleoside-diphosphate-sugar epimerase